MKPWPRRLVNFPIILLPICGQCVVGASLLWDIDVHLVTSVHSLYEIVRPQKWLGGIMIAAALLAGSGFWLRRKIETLLCLLPQQLLLYIAAGGSLRAIWYGQFADGVVRTPQFLLADQIWAMLPAAFHTWAMILILIYAENVKEKK